MPYEIDFLQPGDSNGDAIALRYGSVESGYTIHVIDGAYASTGDVLINHIWNNYDQPAYIDHVVLSHADNDHAGGLIKVFENYYVGHLWMNRPWRVVTDVIGHFHGNFTETGLIADIRRRHQTLIYLEALALSNGAHRRSMMRSRVLWWVSFAFSPHTVTASCGLSPIWGALQRPTLTATPWPGWEGWVCLPRQQMLLKSISSCGNTRHWKKRRTPPPHQMNRR